MQEFMKRIVDLEAAMDADGAFAFGGNLHGPDASKVVKAKAGKVTTTDGPFAETKEQIAGFYIINANDDDAALDWAGRVSEAVGKPIEIRRFAATGRAQA